MLHIPNASCVKSLKLDPLRKTVTKKEAICTLNYTPETNIFQRKLTKKYIQTATKHRHEVLSARLADRGSQKSTKNVTSTFN